MPHPYGRGPCEPERLRPVRGCELKLECVVAVDRAAAEAGLKTGACRCRGVDHRTNEANAVLGAGVEERSEGAERGVGLVVSQGPHGEVVTVFEGVVPYAFLIVVGDEEPSPSRPFTLDVVLAVQP